MLKAIDVYNFKRQRKISLLFAFSQFNIVRQQHSILYTVSIVCACIFVYQGPERQYVPLLRTLCKREVCSVCVHVCVL